MHLTLQSDTAPFEALTSTLEFQKHACQPQEAHVDVITVFRIPCWYWGDSELEMMGEKGLEGYIFIVGVQ